MKRFSFLLFFLGFFFLGCEKKIDTNFHKIHWDRDMCQQCKMVVSDRKHTVEVINPDDGESYVFDDLGCTVEWFKEKNLPWQKRAIIWITDSKTGQWINAKEAYYDTDSRTPMDYGFGAYKNRDEINKNKKVVRYNEVVIKILRGEHMGNPAIRKNYLGKTE